MEDVKNKKEISLSSSELPNFLCKKIESYKKLYGDDFKVNVIVKEGFVSFGKSAQVMRK